MGGPQIIYVDPRTLHLPHSRASGADPVKLQRQIARHARSADGMPPIWVLQDADGELMIMNGATRATRIAKVAPGVLVPVEIIGASPSRVGKLPTIGERLP